MSIALFAIIGATLKMSVWYWICFAGYCLCKLIEYIAGVVKVISD